MAKTLWKVRRIFGSYVDTFVEADSEGEAAVVVEHMGYNTDELVENRVEESCNMEIEPAGEDDDPTKIEKWDIEWVDKARQRYRQRA